MNACNEATALNLNDLQPAPSEGASSRDLRHARLMIAALLAAALAAACATPAAPKRDSVGLAKEPISRKMLLAESPLAGNGQAEASVPTDNILELTPEMVSFVERNVDRDSNEFNRVWQLTNAIMGGTQFELIYDETTRTAEQTFQDRRGNCLSFTNLFVAMARNLGLEASYQEVETPPDWSMRGQSLLLSKHVNVYTRLSQGNDWIVDFNFYDFNSKSERNIISDRRALAHFYNNIGVEWMLNGDTPAAFANFAASLQRDSGFAPAWANLGILYRREGYPAYAEAAYFAALDEEPDNLVAMSNLTSLYAESGRTDMAEEYRQRVVKHRMKNPYYRYFLANDAFENGDYQTAIKHLKYAIRKREEEPKFYSLLSLSYLMSGDREAAQHWMAKAETVAASQDERQVYSQKLRWLMQKTTQRYGTILMDED